MAEKPIKRLRVQRLEEWDGARYSVIPADAWADLQLTQVHLRVLAAIGRVNTQLGWCEFSQTGFAKLVGNGRQAVSEAVNDLVRWRYVEMKGQKRTRLAVCHYRVLIDDPIIEAEVEHIERGFDVDAQEDVSSVGDTSAKDDVSAQDDTGVVPKRQACPPEATPPIYKDRAREILDQRSLPPLPPSGGNSAHPGDEQWKTAALAGLRAGGRHPLAVEHLIAPLLSSDKRLSLGKGAERNAVLAEIAEAASGLSIASLKAAAQRIIEQPKKVTPTILRAEVDQARKGGAMFVIRPSMPQWKRWLEHYDETNPQLAKIIRKDGTSWQVPSEWPPARSERGAA